MKYFLTILFLCWLNCYATNYYVDNAGSDGNTGTSAAFAWQTVAKVNSMQGSLNPGDKIYFKSGGTWNERLVMTASGTQAIPITISSYGIGNAPLITGFQTLSGFTNIGNIWTATAANASITLNMILINGKTAYKARYPNTGYLTFNSWNADSSITGMLTGSPNYAGKEIVIRSAPWILDISKVTSHVAGKLNFTPKLTYTPQYGGNGYFFQNDVSFLDSLNEWVYDSTSKLISIYQTTSPIVQVSTIDTLVWLKGSWLTFNGINFIGANKKIFQIDTCRGITIQNCSLNYSGSFGILALKSNLLSINNDSIQNCYSGGIYGRQLDFYTTPVNQCDSATVSNNYVSNIGKYAGMGERGEARYDGIYVQGLNLGPKMTGNRVDSTGYIGIAFHGKKSLIKNNIVSNVCFVKDDGGAIYTVSFTPYFPVGVSDSSSVISNIVYNAIGATAGTNKGIEANGIYMDNETRYVTVDSNTIYNCGFAGMFFHQNTYIKFRNNNLLNNLNGIYMSSLSETTADSLYITNNSYYSNTQQSLLYAIQSTASLPYLGTIDSNYYANPWGDANSFYFNSAYKNFPTWQTYSGKDVHSFGTPTGVNKWPVLFIVNTLPVSQTFRILGTFIAVNGLSYTNYVTLSPYQSITLLKATTDVSTPFPIPSTLPLIIKKVIQR